MSLRQNLSLKREDAVLWSEVSDLIEPDGYIHGCIYYTAAHIKIKQAFVSWMYDLTHTARTCHARRNNHPISKIQNDYSVAICGTFHSLDKVLFTFPSWYLIAIGSGEVQNLIWCIPHALQSLPRDCDFPKIEIVWQNSACWRTLTFSHVFPDYRHAKVQFFHIMTQTFKA